MEELLIAGFLNEIEQKVNAGRSNRTYELLKLLCVERDNLMLENSTISSRNSNSEKITELSFAIRMVEDFEKNGGAITDYMVIDPNKGKEIQKYSTMKERLKEILAPDEDTSIFSGELF